MFISQIHRCQCVADVHYIHIVYHLVDIVRVVRDMCTVMTCASVSNIIVTGISSLRLNGQKVSPLQGLVAF